MKTSLSLLYFMLFVAGRVIVAQPDNMLAYINECLSYIDAGGSNNLQQEGLKNYFAASFSEVAFESTFRQTAEYSWDTVAYHYIRALYFLTKLNLPKARDACYHSGQTFVYAASADRNVMSRYGLTLQRINHLREFIDFGKHSSRRTLGFDGEKEVKGYTGYADLGEIPAFPWPPPQASTDYVMPTNIWSGVDTLGAVDDRLQQALDACGYFEQSYFAVPGGFALVTRLEQFNDDGTCRPGKDRWNISLKPTSFNMADYFRALFWGRKGRYRLIVFIVTDRVFAEKDEGIRGEDARQWLRTGAKYLTPTLAAQPFGKNHRCTALVYEFELEETLKEPRLLNPASQPGRIHIQASGLWDKFK